MTFRLWQCFLMKTRFHPPTTLVFTGIFGPSSFSFVAPFLAEFNFGRNFGIWGVQIITMEGPAHTALFQPIWNHPARQKGRKRKQKNGFWFQPYFVRRQTTA